MDTRRKLRNNTLLTSALNFLWALLVFSTNLASAQTGIQIALTNEPPSLNSLQATDEISMFVLMHTQEGLLNYGANNELVAGVAKSWQLDQRQARFELNPEARWCDGSPVTADDFIFAWREALKPSTASPYAFLLYPIKNAREINQGKLSPEQLGVYRAGENTLVVDLAQPTAHFLSLTTFPTFYPVKADFYLSRANRYGAEAEDLLCNGAFLVKRWVHGASMELIANPQYWNAKHIALQRIDVRHITNDSNTLFNLFQSKEIAYAEINRDTLPHALKQRQSIHSFSRGSISYLEFNVRAGLPTADINLRRAIASVIDRQILANKVIADPGTRPATHFFPGWLEQVQASKAITASLTSDELAALKPLLSNVPKLRLLIYDSPPVLRQAEFMQRVIQQELGIELIIDRQIFKQKLAKLKNGDFDIAISAWAPDYADPMTFAELLTSSNANNHGGFANALYDQHIQRASEMLDSPERNGHFIAAHDILAEQLPVFPLTEPGVLFLQDPRIKGLRRSRFGGDPDFRYIHFEAAAQ